MKASLALFFILFNTLALLGQPVVSSGAAANSVTGVISARWRGFSGAGAALYLGNSNIGAGGTNRVQYTAGGMYIRPGNNSVSFSYDRINNRLIASINGNTIFYNNVSSFLLGSANLCRMNYMNILLRNSGATGTVAFNSINLDGNALPNLSIPAGGNVTWNVQNYDFSNGFTLSGTIVLSSGTYSGSESAKLEISVGEKTPVTSTSVSAFCAGGIATVSFGGLLPNKNYTIDYNLDTDGFTSPVFTTNSAGAGSFDLGTMAVTDIGKLFTANIFSVAGGCNWNGTVFNTSTLVEDVGCLVLPVSGLELNVSRKGDKVMVNWSTASERNASHFLVENSIDGSNWNNAGRVEAKGNSQIKTEYSFQFKPAGQGKSFFRLRQVDKDGKFFYSQVKTLSAVKMSSFSVSPNPVSGRLYISVPGMLRLKKVSLINAEGKVVFELSCLCSGTAVDMNKLSPGVYIVRLTMEDGEVHFKRVVRN